jgi:glycosyltransferase involved in cell wall biosynthesis
LIEAIRLLLNDKEYAQRLGKNGKNRVEQNFSWTTIVKKIKTAIDQ